jgi:hypothetical protein
MRLTQVMTQEAGGGAWSEPRTLLAQEMLPLSGVPKVVANKLVVLSSGAWLLPFW